MSSLVGTVLDGRYRIDAQIGDSAFGTVYLAQQLSLGRTVVVKVKKSANTGGVERFAREAQVLAKLEHPHIVRIHEFGAHEGLEFIVTEHVEGMTLKDVLHPDERLEGDEAISILKQLCDALAHAHAQNIVHRDLNPSNILITHDETVKILDFGLARLMTPSPTGGTAPQTAFGLQMIAPEYMSPEQCQGQPVTFSTDLYSLGAIAYRIVSGEPPFKSDKAMLVVKGHITQAPRPLTEVVGVRHREDEALFFIIHQLLEKDPSHRPPSAKAVREMLDSVGAGAPARAQLGGSIPVEAAPEPVAEPSNLSLLVAAVLIVFVMAGGAYFFYGSSPSGSGSQEVVERAYGLVSDGRAQAAILELGAADAESPQVQAALGHAFASTRAYKDATTHFERAAVAPELFDERYVEDLRKLLASGEEPERVDAVLFRLGAKTQKMLEQAYSAKGAADRVRIRAGSLLKRMGQDVDLVPAYIQLLKSGDCDDRAEAIKRLHQLEDKRALPLLKRYARTNKCGSDAAKEAARHIASAGK